MLTSLFISTPPLVQGAGQCRRTLYASFNWTCTMNRSQLIESIRNADPFYEAISYEALSDDDLLVIKFSIEANDKLLKGLSHKRTLEFQKQSQTFFITRNGNN